MDMQSLFPMRAQLADYLYPLLTVLLTVYGQIIVKWRVSLQGGMPVVMGEKVRFVGHLLLDLYVWTAFLGAFFAAVSWMIAMTKFELSFAYPFMSLSFVLVLLLSALFFR